MNPFLIFMAKGVRLSHFTDCIVCRGVVPFSQRKKMLEKARAKNKKPKSSAGMSSIPNITVGTQVRLNILKYCLPTFLYGVNDTLLRFFPQM